MAKATPLAPLPTRANQPAPVAGGLPELSAPQVYATLNSRPTGLTEAEVNTLAARFGPNTIQAARGVPLWLKFLNNFTHLMALLLWAGGIIGFLAQLPQIGIAIWLVNVINGLFSFGQEYRAERATAALRQMLPAYTRVRREGEETRVRVEAVVPGDVLLLAEGDRICADARLVEEAELWVDQSTFTGESHPIHKSSYPCPKNGLAETELPNLVFAGTNVVSGTGVAVVFATAMATRFGNIAHLTQSMTEEPSPLQKELGRVTRLVSILAVVIGLVFFGLAIGLAQVSLAESFIFAMGMIVAFVPEGMLPTVTLSLALGVQRMARRHALVKKLSAVETLGCTTVICTDKTGTLTQNEMTVVSLWLNGQKLSVSGVGYAPQGQILAEDKSPPVQVASGADLHELLRAAALCNDAKIIPPITASSSEARGSYPTAAPLAKESENGRWTVLGDPTEAALRVVALKAGLNLEQETRRTPRWRELPFDSHRKRMSTLHKTASGERLVYVKGAPKELLALCSGQWQGGQVQPLSEAQRQQILAANDEYARAGLRVLAVARRALPGELGPTALNAETVERELTFLGLLAMMDPPRPEVAQAVKLCRRAGIRIVMITGDYGLTAESIARRVGIVSGPQPRLISGQELDKLDERALQENLAGEVIFARVSPEHKLRIVQTLQAMGQIVAVTGDGVNDAPALKKADIGVAMGLSGTDVAKEAADMILTDDNFASIVNAIEEGRAVFANIRKFVVYVFNSNMAEAVPFIVMLFSRGLIPLPLTIMQVLAIDLGTDMVPAIGLGSEMPQADVMERPPRSLKEPLLTGWLLVRALLWYGGIESGLGLLGYFYVNWLHGWPTAQLAQEGTLVYIQATTLTLGCIVAGQVGAVFGCRSDYLSIWRIGFFSNRLVLLGVAVELCLLGALIYLPFFQAIFNTAPLGWLEIGLLVVCPALVLLPDEGRKAIQRHRPSVQPASESS